MNDQVAAGQKPSLSTSVQPIEKRGGVDEGEQLLAVTGRCGPRDTNGLVIGMLAVAGGDSSPEQEEEESPGTTCADSEILWDCDGCEREWARFARTDGLYLCAECAVLHDDCPMRPLDNGPVGQPLLSSAQVRTWDGSPDTQSSSCLLYTSDAADE